MRRITAIIAAFFLYAVAVMAQPIVTTLPVQDIGHFAVDAYGEAVPNGPQVDVRGFVWSSTDPNPDVINNEGMVSESGPFGTDDYTLIVDQLDELTNYYIRAFAEDINGLAYGNVETFMTLKGKQPNDECALGLPIEPFGVNGVSELMEAANYFDTDIAIDMDDNVYVAGGYTDNNLLQDGITIQALDENGMLRLNWGMYGRFTYPDPFAGNLFFTAPKVITDMYGNLYVATSYSDNSSGTVYGMLFIKFLQDGTLDASFGVNGMSDIPFPVDVAINDVGLIGQELIYSGTSNDNDIAILGKLDIDGSTDLNFGSNGIVSVDNNAMNADAFQEIFIDMMGNIFASRQDLILDNQSQPIGYFQVVDKYLSDGTIDPTFGVAGTTFPFGSMMDQAQKVQLASDGYTLFVAMELSGNLTGGLIAALMMDGSLDANFGQNGVTNDPLGANGVYYGDLVAGMDGYLYLSGNYQDQNLNNINQLQRIEMTGNADPTFSPISFVNNYMSPNDNAAGLELFSDGSVLATNKYQDPNFSYNDMVDLYRICTDGGKGGEQTEGVEFEQSAYIGISGLGYKDASFVWSPGDGDGRVVFITEAGLEPYIPMMDELFPDLDQPLSSYAAPGADFGNSVLVYNGPGNMVSVTDLDEDTEYDIHIYEYMMTENGLEFNLEPAPGNPRVFNTQLQMYIDVTIEWTSATDSKLFIDWTDNVYAEGAVTYDVMLSRDANFIPGYDTPIDIGMISEYEFSGLLPSTEYFIWIRTRDMMSTSELSLQGPISTLAPEPAAPDFLMFGERTIESMELGWYGMADGFMVLAYDDLNGPMPAIMDGMEYFGDNNDYMLASEPFGAGAGRLVYQGSLEDVMVTGLPMDKPFYFAVVPYNGSGMLRNYGEAIFGTHTTLAPEPAPASNLMMNTLSNGDVELSWQYIADGSLLTLNDVGSTAGPEDGFAYQIGNMFMYSNEIIEITDFMNDNGMAMVTVSGLTPGTEYTTQVYAYNGETYYDATSGYGGVGIQNNDADPQMQEEGSQNYSEPETMMFIAKAAEPDAVDVVVAQREVTSVELDWTTGAMNAVVPADNYLVLANVASVLGSYPNDGDTFLDGQTVGTSFDYGIYVPGDFGPFSVVYNGPATMATVNGLDPDTEYIFYVVPYTGGYVPGDENYSAMANSVTTYTYAAQPSPVADLMIDNTTQTSIELSWTNANNDMVVVLRNTMDVDCGLMQGSIADEGTTLATCNSEVIYVGNGTGYTDMNLMANTTYYYDVYTRAGSDHGTIVTYNYSTVEEIDATTDALPEPTSLSITSIPGSTTSGEDFSVTVTLLDQSSDPIDATADTDVTLTYNNTAIGSGTMSSGSSTVTITANLTGSAMDDAEITASAAGLISGMATIDILAGQPSQISNLGIAVSRRNLNLSWTLPSDADGVLVFARKGSSTDNADPMDGTAYTASAFDNNSTDTQLVYSGNANGFSLTDLTRYTRYYFAVYTYAGSGTGANYNPDEALISARTRAKEGEAIIDDKDYIGLSFNATDIYPNPVNENIVFELENEEPDNIFTIELTDVTGKVVASYLNGVSYPVSSQRMSFPLSSEIAEGNYYLSISNGAETIAKVVKVQR